jgi:hypothetical protein
MELLLLLLVEPLAYTHLVVVGTGVGLLDSPQQMLVVEICLLEYTIPVIMAFLEEPQEKECM